MPNVDDDSLSVHNVEGNRKRNTSKTGRIFVDIKSVVERTKRKKTQEIRNDYSAEDLQPR